MLIDDPSYAMEDEYPSRWFDNLTDLSYNLTSSLVQEVTLATELGDDDEYTPYSERPETYIVPVLFAFIFVVGVLGNGTLVVVFLRHRAMRNVPNT